ARAGHALARGERVVARARCAGTRSAGARRLGGRLGGSLRGGRFRLRGGRGGRRGRLGRGRRGRLGCRRRGRLLGRGLRRGLGRLGGLLGRRGVDLAQATNDRGFDRGGRRTDELTELAEL